MRQPPPEESALLGACLFYPEPDPELWCQVRTYESLEDNPPEPVPTLIASGRFTREQWVAHIERERRKDPDYGKARVAFGLPPLFAWKQQPLELALTKLRDEDWLWMPYRPVIRALRTIREQGLPEGDCYVVSKQMTATDLAAVGGLRGLWKLQDEHGMAGSAPYFVDCIKEASKQRRIDAELVALQAKGRALTSEERARRMAAIADEFEQAHVTIVPMREAAAQVVKEMAERRATGNRRVGITTGLPRLDRLTGGGWRPGDYIVVGARPSVGKSALGLAWCIAMSRAGVNAVWVSVEMATGQVVQRVLANVTGIDHARIRDNFVSRDEGEELETATAIMPNFPHVDIPRATVAEVRSVVKDAIKGREVESCCIIDYLQILEPSNPKDTPEKRIAGISRDLKQMARRLKIPVIALCQLVRPDKHCKNNPAPVKEDVRESGQIEQDADVLILLHQPDLACWRDHPADISTLELIVDKQRNGPRGAVFCTFDRTKQRIYETEKA